MSVWYEEGLRFACTRCGKCCTGHGYVWMSGQEIEALADHLQLGLEAFARRYLRQVGDRLSLVERADGDCVFWDREAGCTVYAARPRQCRTFPFWPANLGSQVTWEAAAAGCPGIDRGRLYDRREIEALVDGQGTATAGAEDDPEG